MRKRITSVRLFGTAPASGWQTTDIERVMWIEDGNVFSRDEPSDKVARAINSGEAFYVRRSDNPDSADVPVLAKLVRGRYVLTAQPDAAPDAILALPTYVK